MKRRQFIETAGLGAAALALGGCAAPGAPPQRRPTCAACGPTSGSTSTTRTATGALPDKMPLDEGVKEALPDEKIR